MPKKELKTMPLEEFAQHIENKAERNTMRIKGLHLVLNALINLLRDLHPDVIEGATEVLSSHAMNEEPNEYVQEVIDAYLTVMMHGHPVDDGLKQ